MTLQSIITLLAASTVNLSNQDDVVSELQRAHYTSEEFEPRLWTIIELAKAKRKAMQWESAFDALRGTGRRA